MESRTETTSVWQKVARGTGTRVTVSVGRVRFEDGSAWTGTRTVGQVPACADALKAERARFLQIYQTQGLDGLLTELKKQ